MSIGDSHVTPGYSRAVIPGSRLRGMVAVVQGYLAHKKTSAPHGSPQGPMHRYTVGS
jgi:hypothetical protein